MNDFLTAVGLLFVIEGLLYAVFPDGMQRMMQQARGIVAGASTTSLRIYLAS